MTSLPDRPARAMLPLLFGREPAVQGDWNQLRADLVAPLKQRARAGGLLYMLAGMIGAMVAPAAAAPLLKAGWLILFIAAHLMFSMSMRRRNSWKTAGVSASEYSAVHRYALVQGLLWAPLFLIGGAAADLESTLALWGVTVAVLIMATLLLSALPVATVIFALVTSGMAAAAFLMAGAQTLALVAVLLAVMLSYAALRYSLSLVLFRMAERDLHEKSATVSLLLREFEDTSADWLWQTDAARRLIQVSPRLASAIGSTNAELEGVPLLRALAGPAWEAGQFDPALRDLAERLKRRETISNLVLPVRLEHQTRWWELSASPRIDDAGKFLGYRGVGSDVTVQRESADKIAKMARYDDLTGLPNRLHLTEKLTHAIQEAIDLGSNCALLMIDLDRFKVVNDTLGHPVGDALLAQVSARLRNLVDQRSMCGRLGGDEFAVVMRHVGRVGEVEALASHIITSVSRPYDVDGHTLYVGASVGFAMAPREGTTVETLTRNADLALYRAKDQGGNSVSQYDPSMHAQAEERRIIEIELRQALERGEFELHYQPVVSADDAMLDGFEALLRWKNARLGQVSPAKFIPIAEDARLIGAIGEWALRTACDEAMKWPSNLKIAVNVSAEQLCDAGFASVLVSALANSGLPPRRLEIEVTESVFIRDGGSATVLLDKLLSLGVRLSLDDFGTGYSSLGYLRKTRFSTIKVDRSFVTGAAKSIPESVAIIRAVVALADSLGMSTTAEGVETSEEVATIKALGCRKIQGYFYGKPMPASAVMALFGKSAPATTGNRAAA